MYFFEGNKSPWLSRELGIILVSHGKGKCFFFIVVPYNDSRSVWLSHLLSLSLWLCPLGMSSPERRCIRVLYWESFLPRTLWCGGRTVPFMRGWTVSRREREDALWTEATDGPRTCLYGRGGFLIELWGACRPWASGEDRARQAFSISVGSWEEVARLGKSITEGLEVRGELPVRGEGRRASGWGLVRRDEGRWARCGGALWWGQAVHSRA